jgi:hypothetical protein
MYLFSNFCIHVISIVPFERNFEMDGAVGGWVVEDVCLRQDFSAPGTLSNQTPSRIRNPGFRVTLYMRVCYG